MIPLIVNTPDPMLKVRVMTPKDYSTQTLKALHTAGVLHVEESEELKPVDRQAIEHERREIGELLTDIGNVLAYVPKGEKVLLGKDIEVIYNRPLDETGNEVRALCTKLGNMHQRAARVQEEIRELTELSKYLGSLGQQADIRLRDLNFSGSYLFSRVFILPNEAYETSYQEIKDHLFESVAATVENETVFYAVAKVEDQETIECAVKAAGGKILQIPADDLPPMEFVGLAAGKIRSREEELARLRGDIQSETKENLEKLVLLREALLAENERLSVLEKACEAKYVTLIEGWIPETGAEETVAEIKENVDYVFVDTRKPEETEEPPTKLKNLTGLKPFQIVVNLFGTPKYREWDPTPIIAYSFAFFFGLMLGDVVYGAIIILFANRGLRLFVDDPESEGFKLFQRLIYISGGVGIVIGLLTGAYLGDFYTFFNIESLALVDRIKETLENPMSFIILSLVIGLIHVNIGHVLGLIKGLKEKQKGVPLGKAGLFILQIAGIPWILHNILHVDIPWLPAQAYPILLYIVGVGLILIIASSIIQNGRFLGAIFWLFDVTGVLGDVMSYCRIAGVSLATFYLASCFNMMAGLLRDMMPAGIGRLVGGTLLAIIILLLGHALNLVLSGITCFVHSLRLCFVEFLFKFFDGGGRQYSPFRLRKRALMPVKGGI